jgi:Tfp pilus assembly protein PilE
MNRKMRRMRGSREAGFTAVELVISIVILGIIMVPLATSFVLSLGTTAEANQRTINSSDVQLVTTYFSTDVASSEGVAVSSPLTTSTSAPSSCGEAGHVVMRLDWVGDSTTHRYVAYVVEPNDDPNSDLNNVSVFKLVRVYCENNGGAGPLLATATLSNTLSAEPQLQCDGSPCPTGNAPAAISPSPLQLSLTLVDYGRKSTDPKTSFTVQATRRVTS